MEASRRDATDEWVLSEQARPPLLSELEARIEHALETARSSEAAAIAVGSTALDAAEQARRSAELAERAHKLVSERLASDPGPERLTPAPPEQLVSRSKPAAPQPPPSPNGPAAAEAAHEEDQLSVFTARADSVAARLQRLQRLPLAPALSRDRA